MSKGSCPAKSWSVDDLRESQFSCILFRTELDNSSMEMPLMVYSVYTRLHLEVFGPRASTYWFVDKLDDIFRFCTSVSISAMTCSVGYTQQGDLGLPSGKTKFPYDSPNSCRFSITDVKQRRLRQIWSWGTSSTTWVRLYGLHLKLTPVWILRKSLEWKLSQSRTTCSSSFVWLSYFWYLANFLASFSK